MKTRLEISAGGVIYRRHEGEVEVCLIATQGGKAWQLPKGLVEHGEEAEAAAEREVGEETGLRGELVRPLERIEYWYVWEEEDGTRERVHKYVDFFLFRYTGGSTADHDDEVDDAAWVPLARAREQLSFKGEQGVLALATKAIAEEA